MSALYSSRVIGRSVCFMTRVYMRARSRQFICGLKHSNGCVLIQVLVYVFAGPVYICVKTRTLKHHTLVSDLYLHLSVRMC